VGSNDAAESADDATGDATNAQSQHQWNAAVQQGQGMHQQHPPPPFIGNPAFRVMVSRRKPRGGLSKWKISFGWLNVRKKKR